MAIRKIRYIGDEILKKKCKPVKNMTPSIETYFSPVYIFSLKSHRQYSEFCE